MRFYDDLADYYELIFRDWESSMTRQGAAISEVLLANGPRRDAAGFRVLDAAAGIGTQALPLAKAGFQVTARDLSERAIARLRGEARARRLDIDTARVDMRELADTVHGPFDAVICMDNSIPHLLTDADIRSTFAGFHEVLAEGGLLLLSVRDYDQVDRSADSVHPYGERSRADGRFRLRQEWTWLDVAHYRTTFVIEKLDGAAWKDVLRTSTEYHAIPVARLLELMSEAGFDARLVTEVPFYQPLLMGRRAVRVAMNG